jgi:hypothetical protein
LLENEEREIESTPQFKIKQKEEKRILSSPDFYPTQLKRKLFTFGEKLCKKDKSYMNAYFNFWLIKR